MRDPALGDEAVVLDTPDIKVAPIQYKRTFERVVDSLVDAIDAYGLQTGDRLPNEAALADMLQVSRPTLRQALRILEASGVIAVRQGKSGGVFIASDMIPVAFIQQNVAHEVDHVRELVAARRLIEPIVVHLAAEHASQEELERIADTIPLMEKYVDDPIMVERADGMFHRRMAHAAGNTILLSTISSIYRQLIPMRHALRIDEAEVGHMIDVHSRQLAALRARDHVLLDKVLAESFIDLEEEFDLTVEHGLKWVVVDRTALPKQRIWRERDSDDAAGAEEET